jgi:hypothetical protein
LINKHFCDLLAHPIFIAVASYVARCDDNELKARVAKKFAQEEAIEKEAHKTGWPWYEVQIGKFDGQYVSAGSSARAAADSYHAYAVVGSTQQMDDHLWIRYSMSGPFYNRIYTTSED